MHLSRSMEEKKTEEEEKILEHNKDIELEVVFWFRNDYLFTHQKDKYFSLHLKCKTITDFFNIVVLSFTFNNSSFS
jgi:hypothetical protein